MQIGFSPRRSQIAVEKERGMNNFIGKELFNREE